MSNIDRLVQKVVDRYLLIGIYAQILLKNQIDWIFLEFGDNWVRMEALVTLMYDDNVEILALGCWLKGLSH